MNRKTAGYRTGQADKKHDIPSVLGVLSPWISRVLQLGIIALPLVIIVPALDSFRLPKEVFLRGLAILLAAMFGVALILGETRLRLSAMNRVYWIVAAVVGWTGIATLFSTNIRLSLWSLGWVAAAATIFVATYVISGSASVHFAAIALVPAVINAAIVTLQTAGMLLLSSEPMEKAAMRTALVGNPRDLGAYIVAPALAAFALSIVARGAIRFLYLAVGVFLIVPIIVTEGVTPAAALAVSITCLLVAWRRRAGIAVAAVVFVVAVAFLSAYPPLRARATKIVREVRGGNFDAALTYRATAYLAAWRMATEHPLVGVGPGCFGWQYFPHKLAVEREYPQLLRSLTRQLNFSEAHNDHLQVLAVAGLPGYALFLGCLCVMAVGTFRRPPQTDDPRSRFSQLISLPLATAIFVLALAFFPLSLGVTVGTYTFLAAIALRWSSM